MLAFITDRGAVKQILEHLGLPSTGPAPAAAGAGLGQDNPWQDDVPALQLR